MADYKDYYNFQSPALLPGEPARATDVIALERKVSELESVVERLVKDYYTPEPQRIHVGDVPPATWVTPYPVTTAGSVVTIPRNPSDVQRIAELENALAEAAAELEQTLNERDDAEQLACALEGERDDLFRQLEEAESKLTMIKDTL